MKGVFVFFIKNPSFIILLLSATASSCAVPQSTQRQNASPPISEKFKTEGHIEKKSEPDQTVDNIPTSIPKLVAIKPVLPPKPIQDQVMKGYSVSAVNVPVDELLFKLAQDANKQLDLKEGVAGNVSINAINQPLDTILERLAESSGFVYRVDKNGIKIYPDLPEWRNYKVDYVFIKKTSIDNIDMKMTVASNEQTGGSTSNVNVSSEHDFWTRLKENIEILAQPDPLEARREQDVLLQSDRLLYADGVDNMTLEERLAVSQKSNPLNATIKRSINTLINPEAGVISVYTTDKKHKAISQYISDLKTRSQRQVLIEATVVEVELSDQYQAGINWSALLSDGANKGILAQSLIPANLVSNSALALDFASGDWDMGIRLLQQFGTTQVLSSPKIMAVNNQTALLKVVNNEVYFTIEVSREAATTTSAGTTTYETTVHTVPVGFMMSVTPFVSDDDSVSLNIRPTISRIVGYVNDPSPDLARENIVSRIPVIQEREMASVLKLNNRQTAVIGGLIEDIDSNDKDAVPWVNEVPFFGDLFAYKDEKTSKSELVIFIRPIVIKNPDVDHGDLKPLRKFLKSTRMGG